MINVLIWNEYRHEKLQPPVAEIYPDGIHGCIRDFLSANDDISVRCAYLDMEGQGLSEEILNDTDVLIWWGHMAHDEVTDENAEMICRHIRGGMGFIALHSAHHSKIFKRLMGTSCNLQWRHGDRERLWCIQPSHPIAQGVPTHFELPLEEMYGEPFDIPNPEDIIFMGWFAGGQVFRSGITFRRGKGKIFYFQPGHEEYPIFHDPNIRRIITNAVRWAAPAEHSHNEIQCFMGESLENT